MRDASFRPAPVFAIGIVADGRAGSLAGAGTGARATFAALRDGCARIVEREARFFSPLPLRVRAVTRLANAEEHGLARAAREAGVEIAVISADGAGSLVFDAWREPPECAVPDPVPNAVPDGSPSRPAVPTVAGTVADALLAQCDVLLAAWDGTPDATPGSTGALVQEALERRIPVLVLGPDGADVGIIDDPEAHLLPPVAAALPRVRLADNLDRVLSRAFAPPAGREERQALADCLAEPPAPRTLRPEYKGLLLLAARRRDPAPVPAGAPLSGTEEWARAAAVAAGVSPSAARMVADQAARHARMEELAAFHGERARSGVVLRYSGPAFGALMIALLAILAPDWSLAWLGVQAVVMTVTITEATFATRGRWGERWLDYRSLAERLRCDRFLAPLGIGLGRLETDTEAEDPAWMRWCHRRLLREHWPDGAVTPALVASAFRHLAEVEIAGQIRYHEGAAFRYRSLERRLGLISTGSVACIVVATALLLGLSFVRGVSLVSALLMVLLITMPSVFLASRGMRLEGAFELAAARSEQALASLRILRDRMETLPRTYDRLVQASRAAAAAMIRDTVDWRVGLQRSRTPYRMPE